MGINGSNGRAAAAATTSEGGALDVHAHAMPLPLLERLAERGLADLGGVADGVVRLDTRVSGVGPLAPLPLARSQYDVDVRLSEMDDVGVHRHAVSLPPFLFCSTADDRRFATDIVAQGNDELATYVADAPERLLGLGSVPLGWPGAAERGPAGPRRARTGRDRDRQPRWRPRPRRPRQRRPVGPAVRAARVRVPAPERGSRPAPAGGLLAAAARRLPDGDRARGGPAGVRPGARTVPAPPVPGPRWRLPARAARSPGHGLGAQGRRPHDLGPAESSSPTGSTTTRRSSPRRCCGASSRTSAPDHVLLGTDHPFELGDRTPLETVQNLGLDRASTRAILWDNAAGLLGLPVPR